MKNVKNKIVAGFVSGMVIGSIGTSYMLPKADLRAQTASAAVSGNDAGSMSPSTSSSAASPSPSPSAKAPTVNNGSTVPENRQAPQGAVPQRGGKEGHHRGAADLNSVQEVDIAQGQYKDGVYTGEAVGYAPGLQVEVTIASSKIAAIKITKHNETPGFYERAFQVVPQAIIESQSTKVDTISRATYSCVGIMNAVSDALADAKA